MTVATARAHPNIALVKYWGKRDAAQNLPATGSLSMTLDVFPTTTTVALDETLDADAFTLNGRAASGVPRERVIRFLDLVRERAGSTTRARVSSTNTVPSGAGLASSASGFAALAGAAAAAYGLDLDQRALTRLARRGSGSAARSIVAGFAVWHAGDDEHSFAEPVDAPALAMVVATVDASEKPVSSRDAMRRTALTSPYYPAWISSTEQSLRAALAACRDGDVARLGRIAETNALRMHAAIQASDPPIRYLSPASIAILDRVEALRADGVGAFATADAGPNVVVLCRPGDADAVRAALAGLAELIVAHPGPGLHVELGAEAVTP
ncbi:diphosphomevalonate decarboxylase [Microbacterium sp.]|uniref:diphosphomevalonate decarboxylase n=1 Tax=Microbacterium sp. TaxID=51671 RepID=UPI0039E6DB08